MDILNNQKDVEPQLTSDDPNERKLARKLRIERRLAAIEKQSNSELSTDQIDYVDPIQQQIDTSLQQLTKLLIEGDEYVTNIKIANDNREINRRDDQNSNNNNIIKQIEDETNITNESFNQLLNKWNEILNYNDPLDINDGIIIQREHFNDILKQKDAIILMLKEQIKKCEVDFSNDQLKQESDINVLIRRIEKQISLMRKAFRTELDTIEQTIIEQHQSYLESSNKEWENLLKKRDNNETKNLETKCAELENFYKKMKDLQIDYDELYRKTKIQMENQCDQLQCEFEKIKTMLIMNREKLDYNYQILKMKENENILVKSQQKRRLNKLQEHLIDLKTKIDKYQIDNQTKINKLSKQINYLKQNIADIHNKSRHFAKVNDEKFKNLWQMHQEKINNLYGEIMKIDRILYEQQLGINWQSPQDLNDTNDLNCCKSILPILAEIEKPIKEEECSKKNGNFPIFLRKETKIYRRLLKHILVEISKKGDFLIDDQIKTILKPFSRDEKTLVTIDNVFNALNIHDKDDIDVLLTYFLPYMHCPVCKLDENRLNEITENSQNGTSITEVSMTEKFGLNFNKKDDGIGSKQLLFKKDIAENVTTIDEKFTCRYQHQLAISSVYVLKALKDFLGIYHQEKFNTKVNGAQDKPPNSRQITEFDLNFYWNRYKDSFPEEKIQLWDSLCKGLKKYHQALKERKSLCEEVAKLRRENSELKSLLV